MSKKNFVFSIIILLAFISACYLSVSPVKAGVEADDDLDDINITTLSTPKSSGYAVTELWNDTTSEDVRLVAVSADGKYMAVTTDNDTTGNEIFFYNTSDHEGIPMWSYDAGITFDSLAISADGGYIVAGSSTGNIAYLFNSTTPDPGNNKLPKWWVDWGDNVYSVDISANGKHIVIGGNDSDSGIVFLYNNSYPSLGGNDKTSDCLWYCGVPNTTLSVAISADGNYVAAGSKKHPTEDNLFYFNTTDYTQGAEQPPMWSFGGIIIVSDSIKISADGGYIVVNGYNGVALFNSIVPESGNPKIYVWQVDLTHPISTVDISANGKYVAVGKFDGYMFLYNTTKPYSNPIDKTEEWLWAYGTEGIINSASFTADGEYLVVGTDYAPKTGADNESTIFLFESAVDKNIMFHDPDWFFNTSHNVTSVSISRWGNHFAVGGPYTSGRAYLFYHDRPPPPPIPLPTPDDDDDDEDMGIVVVVVVIIILACVGGVVVVVIVLIKKGIIDVSKRKRK